MSVERSELGEPTTIVAKTSGLLIDADKVRAKNVSRVLRSLLETVEVIGSAGEVPPSRRFDLVIADIDGLSDEEKLWLLQRFAAEREQRRLLLCSSARTPEALVSLFGELHVSNVLGSDGGVDGDELLVTVRKLIGGDIFGIEKYFSSAAHEERAVLVDSDARDGVRERARELAASLGAQSRLVETFCTLVDEMTTNALFNAPVDGSGHRRFSHLHRGARVSLEAGESIEVVMRTDGRRLGCAVSDSFGSLQPETVGAYLARCFRRGSDQLSTASGGAGLGLYTIYQASSQLVVNIASGRRTEIIAIVDIPRRFREFLERPKSFHVFTTG